MDDATIEKMARALANELGRQSLDRGQPLGTEDPDMMFLEGRFDLVAAMRAVLIAESATGPRARRSSDEHSPQG